MKFILDKLEEEVKHLGREEWRPLLQYVAELHSRAIMPPRFPVVSAAGVLIIFSCA